MTLLIRKINRLFYIIISFVAVLCFNTYAQDLVPTETKVLVKVYYVDKQLNKPEPDTDIRFINNTTNKIHTFKTNAAGRYEILLLKGQKYKVQVKFNDKFEEYEKLLEIPTTEGQMIMNYTISKPAYKRTYTLNVQYEFNEAVINPGSYPLLDEYANKIKNNPKMVVEIAGHTDNIGSNAYNKDLSQQRANAVRDYLIKKGVSSKRIFAKGYGETQPIISNDTEEGRGRNRRTEIRVIEE